MIMASLRLSWSTTSARSSLCRKTESSRSRALAVPEEMEKQFFARHRSSALRFVADDAVSFFDSAGRKRGGVVVSIVRLDPEPVYVVEPSDVPWGGLELPQSSLTLHQ